MDSIWGSGSIAMEKYYQLGTHTTEQWQELHQELIADGNVYEAVPVRQVQVDDEKLHSPTRGTYLLTLEEAEELKKDLRVKFINIDYSKYDEYKPPKDELQSTRPALVNRFSTDVRHYREFETSNTLPASPGVAEVNRTGYQILRLQQTVKDDPWIAGALADNAVVSQAIQARGSGKNIDVVVADEGMWLGHPEFQNDPVLESDGTTAIELPADFGGNVLPGDGTCTVLDLVLDSPYYIDPDWFNAGADPEYNNGAIIDVVGDGSDFFKREVTVNGVRIMGAGTVGGQTAVPDAWLEKVARMFELFTDPNGSGINKEYQRASIKILSGDTGTYHAGFPTIQRVARGAGADYSTNFLTDEGVVFWNLTNLFDTHVQNDMVWYLNSTGDGYGDGDIDAQEVIEHVFHTLHMHGLPAEDIKLYPFISSDWNTGPLYNAMVEAYDAGKWDPSGYQPPGSPDEWKTNGDAFEVAAKEYLFLLNFCMFEYTSLWEGGSLDPEWTDDMRTQAGIQSNNPLGYAFHNTYIAPIISKPSLATIRSIFQDGNTPDQDDPALAGASGYVVDVADRLTTRWDGTIVPVESVALAWWANPLQRSSKFSSAGTVSISSSYTRENTSGSNNTQPAGQDGEHGTPCGALTYGRTQGWAYNANKWTLDLYGTYGSGIEAGFDLTKLFHQLKPKNPAYDKQDPTVMSNSWGYRANKDPLGSTYYYTHRASSNVSYTTENGIAWLSHMGTQGDGGRWKSEMKTNSLTTALDELCDSGVIFVCAAGNSNQKCVSPTHPDYDNYITDVDGASLADSSFFEFGVEVFGTTNRRGFPQQGGKFTDTDGAVKYKTINIGALDDDYNGGLEAKVGYSDRGNSIDCYTPADGTLAANKSYTNEGPRVDTYSNFSYSGGAYDCAFSGTSAACPVAAGFIATVLEHNRDWTWREIIDWINSLDSVPNTDFYYGVESTTPNAANWTDYESLEGGTPKVLYQNNYDSRFVVGVRTMVTNLSLGGAFTLKANK
jgi:hypothetical protein